MRKVFNLKYVPIQHYKFIPSIGTKLLHNNQQFLGKKADLT